MTAASIICRSDATRDGTHRSLPSQRADVSYVRVSRWQELTLLAVLFVSVYLVGGEYSRAVCTIFTTAPAAVYTCVQLASTRDHTSCYDCWVPANCSTATMAISEETVAVFEGDVTSVPSEEVLFKEPYREIVDLAISNRRGMRLQIKLGVLEPDAVNAETREDILAFDYSFVNEPNIAFDRSFLVKSDPNKRRKKLRICYNDRSSRNRL
ncbi:unnamed protein product [Toxocara canis]|uniref:PITH domain-containing protein n=1 Tax=Toxocara canis TaxID=6265 RepID=A0A183VAH7_TOXCA|nr:unnamed protein product [Toxocara canis]